MASQMVDVEKNADGGHHVALPAPVMGASESAGSTVMSNQSTMMSDRSSSMAEDEKKPKSLTSAEEMIVAGRAALPEKYGNRTTRYLHHNFLTVYRKTFGVIFFANLAAFIAILAKNGGDPKATDLAQASSANLMACLLFRQEYFVNALYELAVCVPHSLPVSIRKKLAKVFHYGGGHSGAGTAAVVWYLLYTIIVTRDYVRHKSHDALANLITSYVVIVMYLFILTAAHPTLRIKFHDSFEMVHRFSGWLALAAFWTHTFFAAEVYRQPPYLDHTESLGYFLIHSSNLWTTVIGTSCAVLSWGRLRRVKVFPEHLSAHVTRLHFKYRNMAPFYGLKVSTRPVSEWHAFATVPDEGGGFSLVVSNAGDWTSEMINKPPTHLWIRGAPLHGLLYTSKLFRRIVVVATGSGIGPCLSLMAADATPRRILWSTQNPEVTYGQQIVDTVKKSDPEAVIWNTRTQGRPDIVALTYQLVRMSDAEAVFIISNPKVTRLVVYGMQTRGVPAYGAIFDS